MKEFAELSRSGKWSREHPEYFKTEQHIASQRERAREYLKNPENAVKNCARSKMYYAENKGTPEFDAKRKKLHQNWRGDTKLRSLQIISGLEVPRCANCGCEDLRILEIDHVNGGGRQEVKREYRSNSYKLRLAVISGKRKVDDLQALCKVCNAKHDAERRFGVKFQVKFIGWNA